MSYKDAAPILVNTSAVTHNIHASNGMLDLAGIWTERARTFGARCVVNLSYSANEFDEVTKRQKGVLFPLLMDALSGNEKTVLDFGCGPGRFSGDLAALTGARVVAFDVCEELVRLAPAGQNVEFLASSTEEFFQIYPDRFDVIWVCLVLGGLPDSTLLPLADLLTEKLNDGGLLFLVEHTSETKAGNDFWKFRKIEAYKELFPTIELNVVGSYLDYDEEVSILTGRQFH